MVNTHINGHKCYYDIKKEDWRYCDDDTSVAESNKRKCKRCCNYETEEGHDACLGKLPGVDYACCGHGVENGYIIFENGVIITGKFNVGIIGEPIWSKEFQNMFQENENENLIEKIKKNNLDIEKSKQNPMELVETADASILFVK